MEYARILPSSLETHTFCVCVVGARAAPTQAKVCSLYVCIYATWLW